MRRSARLIVHREPGLPVRARSHVRLPTIIASSTTARRCGRVSIAHTSRYVTTRVKVETSHLRLRPPLLLLFLSSAFSSAPRSPPSPCSPTLSFSFAFRHSRSDARQLRVCTPGRDFLARRTRRRDGRRSSFSRIARGK